MRGTSSRVGGREAADAVAGLDLHPARARELGGRAARHDLAADEDGHAVAHQLDLAQEMGVQNDGHAAARSS